MILRNVPRYQGYKFFHVWSQANYRAGRQIILCIEIGKATFPFEPCGYFQSNRKNNVKTLNGLLIFDSQFLSIQEVPLGKNTRFKRTDFPDLYTKYNAAPRVPLALCKAWQFSSASKFTHSTGLGLTLENYPKEFYLTETFILNRRYQDIMVSCL